MRLACMIGASILGIVLTLHATAQSSSTSSSVNSASSSSVQTGTGSMQSGTGTTIAIPTLRDRTRLLWKSEHLPTRKNLDDTLTLWEEAQADRRNYRLRLRQHLQDCHDELRRANRDQKFTTTLRCFRGRLMLELTWLRSERQFFTKDASLADIFKQGALDATDALISSLATIVTAIDSDVYASDAGLREAKRLLHFSYRIRQWAAEIRASAARTRALLAFAAKDVGDMLPERGDPALSTFWDTSVECLEDTSAMLKHVENTLGYEEITTPWSSARLSFAACIKTIEKAVKAQKAAGTRTGTGAGISP